MKQMIVHVLVLSLVVPQATLLASGKENSNIGTCVNCAKIEMMPAHKPVRDLDIQKIAMAVSCPNGESLGELDEDGVYRNPKCARDFACNFMRATLNVASIGTFTAASTLRDYVKKAEPDFQKEKACFDASQGDCATSAVAGIIHDLWLNLEGLGIMAKGLLWDLPKATVKAGARKVADWWNDPKLEMQKLEDGVSNAMHWAKGLSWQDVAKFKDNAWDFMKQMFAAIFNHVTAFLQENFACAKWSGAPHLSTCLEPTDDIACASCSQKINLVCGAAAMIATEGLLITFLFNKAGTAIKSSGAMPKIAKLMKTDVTKAGRARQAEATAAKAAEEAARATRVSEYAAKLQPSDLVRVETSVKPKIASSQTKAVLKKYKGEVDEIVAHLPPGLTAQEKEIHAVAKILELEKNGLSSAQIQELYKPMIQARLVAGKPMIDYAKIDTSYLTQAQIQAAHKQYGGQLADLKKALAAEDPHFRYLAESPYPANQAKADTFLVHTVRQMETQGMTPEQVKARIFKAMNECRR